jgi:regulator of protease activity HflC (stomatin/prohibitin superfamily)
MPWDFVIAVLLLVGAVVTTGMWRSRKKRLKAAETARTDAETKRAAEEAAYNAEVEKQRTAASTESAGRGGYRDYESRDRVPTPNYTKVPDMTEENELARQLLRLKRITVGLWIAGILMLGWSSWTQVDTRNVAAVTVFGSTYDTLDDGAHLVQPWTVVHELDAAVQVDTHSGGSCITVRIAHQATACVDMNVKWSLLQDKADVAYQDYREFDTIRNSLVTRELGATSTEVFATYDALAVDKDGNSTAPSNASLSEQATTILQKKANGIIKVDSVVISYVKLDDPTQKRLNDLNEETAKTRTAIQSQKTADAQAEANRKLAGSVSNDPNVLVANCLEIIQTAVDKNYPLPAGGVNCWPGSGSTVVLPSVGGNRPN